LEWVGRCGVAVGRRARRDVPRRGAEVPRNERKKQEVGEKAAAGITAFAAAPELRPAHRWGRDRGLCNCNREQTRHNSEQQTRHSRSKQATVGGLGQGTRS
jgi:hypothetical protein